MKRRDALIVAGAFALALGVPRVLQRGPSEFAFQPLPGFDGFRRLAGGAVSGGSVALLGLDDRLPDQAPLYEYELTDPCLALFGPDGWSDALPIAIFSDFNCPYCQVLEARLIALRDGGAPIRLIWHEMPLLGPSSTRYARAVLAARYLGVEDAARAYLKTHVLRPGPAALADLGAQLGISGVVMQQEYGSARVQTALNTSLELGMRLGIPGTPGTVVGRTLVVGAINDKDLDALIALERATPQTICA